MSTAATAQQAERAAAARTRFSVGEAVIERVVESEVPLLDPFELLPECRPEHIEANLHWLAPRFYDPQARRLVVAIQSHVVRSGGRIIVVDTCVGDCKQRVRAEFMDRRWGWLDRLEAIGIRPEDVDVVVCTHFHVDHVGWNTRLADGRWVPTFPNARYLFTREEWDYWRGEPGRPGLERTGDYVEDSVLPVVEAGLADFVPMDHVIDANVRLMPAAGHTPGLVTVEVASGGDRAVIASDVLHTPLQCRYPEWSTRFCADAVHSRATRIAFMEQHARARTLVMPNHFPSPSAGLFERDGTAFRFRYVE